MRYEKPILIIYDEEVMEEIEVRLVTMVQSLFECKEIGASE